MIRIIIDNLFYMGISAAVFSLLLLLITWISRRRLSSRLYLAGWITALAMLVIPAYAIASMAGFSFSGVFGNSDSNSQAAQYRAAYSEYMEKSVFPAVKDEAIAGSEENAVQPSGTIGTARAAGQVNNAEASLPPPGCEALSSARASCVHNRLSFTRSASWSPRSSADADPAGGTTRSESTPATSFTGPSRPAGSSFESGRW